MSEESPYAGTALERFYRTERFPGRLITFEGIDGVGKSTQALRTIDYLKANSIDAQYFREPGGTNLGESVRAILLDPASKIGDLAEVLLFMASRAQIMEEVIEPKLKTASWVILDRFIDSTVAYQGGGRFGSNEELVRRIHELNTLATVGYSPDLTFYLKAPRDLAKARLAATKLDRLEQQHEEFHDRVGAMYDFLLETHAIGSRRRMLAIDASGSIDEVFEHGIRPVLDTLIRGENPFQK